jgi:hypothetical protein
MKLWKRKRKNREWLEELGICAHRARRDLASAAATAARNVNRAAAATAGHRARPAAATREKAGSWEGGDGNEKIR